VNVKSGIPLVWFNPQENAIEKIPLACNQSRSPTEGYWEVIFAQYPYF